MYCQLCFHWFSPEHKIISQNNFKIVDTNNHSNTRFKNLIMSLERIFPSHDEVTNWESFTNSSVCSSASLCTAMAPLTTIVHKMEKM